LERSETTVQYEGFGMARRDAERKHQAAIDALRAALAEPCPCGDRPNNQCPGEWEPGCDLGSNPEYAKRVPEPGEYHGWVLREVLFDNGEPVGHREPVQEPVAWMCNNEELVRKGYSRFSRTCSGEWNIPVWTHPAPTKTNQCGETCERARLCGTCLSQL
jgi:hypothetical protein